jgi:signal transduction histidine kinase
VKLHLTPKVTLAFLLFAAVLLAAVGILAYSRGRMALEEATFSDLSSTAIEKESAFETWITGAQTNIATAAESPFLSRSVVALRTADSQTARDQVVSELEPMTREGHAFAALMVIEIGTGKVIASTDPNQEGRFKEDRPYFINGQNGPYIQNVYFSIELQSPAITVAAPIKSINGELQAVLAGWLSLTEMTDIISRTTGLRQSADAYLVNTTNLFVTQPRFISDSAVLQRGIRTDAIRACLTGNSGTMLAADYRGVPTVDAYRWLPNHQLCLVVQIDQAEAFESVQAFGRTLLFISGLALLAAFIVAVGLARTITHPIVTLTDGVARFGQGELDIRFPKISDDEIGSLAYEFNTMANAIVEKETLLQNHARDLELRVAERTAKLAFLADASQVLSESLDYSSRLKQLAHLAVPQMADWCGIDVLDENGNLERLAVVHIDPKRVAYAYELQRRFPPDPNAPRGAYNVLRTGKSEFYPEITEDMLIASAPNEEILHIVRELGLKSTMTVPLLAHERTFGIISFVMAESGRHYEKSDLALAEDLARRAGLLIDNAKLYEEAQKLNAELEQRVIERTTQLTAINKELEAFSYSVSHDLRAPLRALDGFSQALEEDYGERLDDDGKNYLNRIRAGSQRMGILIDDLIALSRLTRSEMRYETVDLSELAHLIAAELREQYPQREVEFEVQDGLTVTGDMRLLRVALSNLIGNAWKYTGKQAHPRVEFGCANHNGRQAYFVRDNGAGFDMAYAHKLFGVFQRLHSANDFPGNGIGLATVQRIINRHGGQIWAESTIGQGATFYFSL